MTKSPYHDLWISLGVLGVGGLILLIGRRAFAGSSSSAPGVTEVLKALDTAPKWDAPAANPSNLEIHRQARPIVLAAIRRHLNRDPSLAEIQYGQSVAWMEGRYGRGWKGAMVGSNNWGAVQCAAGSTADCIPFEDSYADGTKYKVSFRRYPTPEDGAADVMRHIFVKRPRTAAALAEKSATVFRASFAMRRERYYEGNCPIATKEHGASRVRASLSDPDRDDATKACAKETMAAHAKLLAGIIQNIAGACGDPGALPLGTFEDADAWYRGTFPDAGKPAAPASAVPAPKPSTPPASTPAPPSSSTTPAPAAPAAPAPAPATPPAPAPASSPPASSPKVTTGLAGGRLVEAVKAGTIDAPTWIEVSWPAAGVVLRVAADALRAPVGGKALRLPVTWRETLEIAHRLDGVPLTAEVSDLIWQAATVKLEPRSLGSWNTEAEKKASNAGLVTLEWSEKLNMSVDRQIGTRSGELAADTGKDWIFSPRLLVKPRMAVTYGWRYPSGKKMIQAPGPDDKVPAHDDAHYDYSQTMRLVQRRAVDGTDLLTVYEKRGMPAAVLQLFSGAS